MGRPREFDTDEALRGAMDVFWRQGYMATNLPDLLQAMGLTRGSFYKAFTDKESVYLEALDYYDRLVVDRTVAALGACDAGSASGCLSMMFGEPEDPGRGCFICNAMVELAPVNAKVAAKTAHMADRLRAALQNVMDRYAVPLPEAQRAEAADVVLHLYFGHQALGKAASAGGNWPQRLARITGEAV